MGTVRKRYRAAFKAQVALEACKGQTRITSGAEGPGVWDPSPGLRDSLDTQL
jgi:hypothetical protein